MKGEQGKQPVVIIGLDAFDVDLLERWSREGRLPFLASLKQKSAFSRLSSTRGLFADAPWPSFNAGVSPAKHAFYCHLELQRGTTQIDRVDARHCRYLPFWSLLRGTGKKIAAFDVPKTFPIPGLDGVQISAWSEHYPLLRQPTSEPPGAIQDILARFGLWKHPAEIIEPRSRRQERGIYQMLLTGLDQKLRATEYLLGQADWDLFISVFSEFHYAGHQFLHHYEDQHWAHEPDAPTDLKTALPDMAAQTDAALAKFFERLPASATYLVVSVHGFEPNYSGNHLMIDVLEKLGYLQRTAEEKPTSQLGALLNTTAAIRKLMPASVRDFINTHLIPEAVHDRAHSDEFSRSVDWNKTRVFYLPSDHFQAFLSVNLKGREPQGTVERGAEFDKLCAELRQDLKALINPDTGRPAVVEVVRTSDVYRGPNLLELPDLVVQWAEDAPIQRLSHPRCGTIDLGKYPVRRTQHAAEGFLIAGGSRINPRAVLTDPSTLDVAPTILHLLGQTIPEEMDGRVLTELLDDEFRREREPQFGKRPELLHAAAGA